MEFLIRASKRTMKMTSGLVWNKCTKTSSSSKTRKTELNIK